MSINFLIIQNLTHLEFTLVVGKMLNRVQHDESEVQDNTSRQVKTPVNTAKAIFEQKILNRYKENYTFHIKKQIIFLDVFVRKPENVGRRAIVSHC